MERKTPSPATVISIIALVFAVAGTAMASVATVSVLSKKEKKQTRRIADREIGKKAPRLSVKHAASADAATNSDQLGGAPAGEFQRRLWAVVRADGTLARGAGAIGSSGQGSGRYEVRFNRDITSCAFTASIGNPADSVESGGEIEVNVASLSNARDTVVVFTANSAGGGLNQGFHLIVAC